MAITVSGTTITFNDATTQTTAATAPTTAQVLSATAAATAGAVGTYAWVANGANGSVAFGSTMAASAIKPSSTYTLACCGRLTNYISTTSLSGTWRMMGATAGYPGPQQFLVLRIS